MLTSYEADYIRENSSRDYLSETLENKGYYAYVIRGTIKVVAARGRRSEFVLDNFDLIKRMEKVDGDLVFKYQYTHHL